MKFGFDKRKLIVSVVIPIVVAVVILVILSPGLSKGVLWSLSPYPQNSSCYVIYETYDGGGIEFMPSCVNTVFWLLFILIFVVSFVVTYIVYSLVQKDKK